MKQTSSKHRA